MAAHVMDLATHRALLCAPDGYRPPCCPTCGHPVMHVHDYRTRECQLGDQPVVRVVRHRCANPDCEARWQTLPGFVARHLHFNWPRVQGECEGATPPGTGRRPSAESVRRWVGRLASCAAQAVRLVCDAGGKLAARVRDAAVRTRRDLVDAFGTSFAVVGAHLHQLLRGVRLV